MNKKTLILLILALFGASNLSAAGSLKDAVVRAGKRVVFVGNYPEWADGQKTALATEALCNALIAPSTYFAAKKFSELKARKEQGASLKDLVKTNKPDVALFAGSSAAALFSLLHMGAAARKGFNSVIHKYYVAPETTALSAANQQAMLSLTSLTQEKDTAIAEKTAVEKANETAMKDCVTLQAKLTAAEEALTKAQEDATKADLQIKTATEGRQAAMKMLNDLKQEKEDLKKASQEQVKQLQNNTQSLLQQAEVALKQANDAKEAVVQDLAVAQRRLQMLLKDAIMLAQAVNSCKISNDEAKNVINAFVVKDINGEDEKQQAIQKFEKLVADLITSGQ